MEIYRYGKKFRREFYESGSCDHQRTSDRFRGGVTTVIDHHHTIPQVFGAKELLEKKEYLKTRSIVDFGLLGGLSLTNLGNLKGLWEGGALGFKGFTCELHEADALGIGKKMC